MTCRLALISGLLPIHGDKGLQAIQQFSMLPIPTLACRLEFFDSQTLCDIQDRRHHRLQAPQQTTGGMFKPHIDQKILLQKSIDKLHK